MALPIERFLMSTMLLRTAETSSNTDQPPADGAPPEAETRMRRALGLLPSSPSSPGVSPRQRNRPADTVVVVEHRGDRGNHGAATHSSVNRVAIAEAALQEERHARELLTRQLREAEAALREAQTKRGHAELAHEEAVAALAAERSAREAAEEQLRHLQQATAPRHATVHALADTGAEPGTDMTAGAFPQPRRRGRPPGSKAKPAGVAVQATAPDRDGAVEWWVPGWRDRI
jgi:hypothetical protein